jgi:hypothetical protein
MKISLDDGKSWIEVQGLRIIKEFDAHIDTDYEEIQAELHFNFTQEGIVTDVWVNNTCEGTESQLYVELGDNLVNH